MNNKSFLNKSPKSIKSNYTEFLDKFNHNSTNNCLSKNSPKEIFLNIKFKSDSRDEITRELKVSLEKKEAGFLISVTEQNDPLTLYQCEISESFYHQLKISQGLVKDFSQFPEMLMEKLNVCKSDSLLINQHQINQNSNNNKNNYYNNNIENENNIESIIVNKHNSSAGSFVCIIEEKNNEIKLIIQYATEDKIINYLVLPLSKPKEKGLLAHVAGVCSQYKLKYEGLLEENTRLKEAIEEANNKINEITEENKNLNQTRQMEIREAKIESEKALLNLKNQHNEEIRTLNDKHSETTSNLEAEFKKEIQILREENTKLKEKLSSLNESLIDANNNIRNFEINEKSNTKILEKVNAENEALKIKNSELSILKSNQEHNIKELNNTLQHYETQNNINTAKVKELETSLESLKQINVILFF